MIEGPILRKPEISFRRSFGRRVEFGKLWDRRWNSKYDCRECGMTEKARCYDLPIGLEECWRPKGVILVWDDEEYMIKGGDTD